MIIEIGTSDFGTQAGKKEGIFIEPILEHFNRLPNCKKENVAISNFEGKIDMYYIPSDVIEKNNLPQWVRGCNSVNNVHPQIVKKGWEKFIIKNTVNVVRILSIIEKYKLESIDFLKIDTEGHDCVILNDFLDTVKILPKKIKFECNVLSNKNDVDNMVSRLEKLGYRCKKTTTDMICTL